MEDTSTPYMGAMRDPGQVVYQGHWAGSPGQIGIGRLISQTQHERQHSNFMKKKRTEKERLKKYWHIIDGFVSQWSKMCQMCFLNFVTLVCMSGVIV